VRSPPREIIYSENIQKFFHYAHGVIEHKLPDNSGDNRGDHQRENQRNAQYFGKSVVQVAQQHCDTKPQHQRNAGGVKSVPRRDRYRMYKIRILEHTNPVAQTYKIISP
jgi:hypothetical protein